METRGVLSKEQKQKKNMVTGVMAVCSERSAVMFLQELGLPSGAVGLICGGEGRNLLLGPLIPGRCLLWHS